MSVYAKVWAYEQHPLQVDGDGNPKPGSRNPAAKAVLVALAEFPGIGQRECWPAQATLAAMTDFEERTVRKHLDVLERQGYISRTERRKKGQRLTDMVTLLGPLEAFGPGQLQGQKPPERHAGGNRSHRNVMPEPPERHAGEPVVEPVSTSKESNDSLSGEAQKTAPSPAKNKLKEVSSGQYGVGVLMDRLKEAREGGAKPPPLTNRQRGEYGEFFAQAVKDGESVEDSEMALRWLVAKAAGDVPNEPEAWAYFGSAQRAVREGWRPKRPLRAVPDPEREREIDELARIEAEIIASAL